jgi:hypothetical protein
MKTQEKENTMEQQRPADELGAIKDLLRRLELDFYSEPLRGELAASRKDLEVLSSAIRAVKSAGILARKEGLSADSLLEDSKPLFSFGGGRAAELKTRIRGVRSSLASMRRPGELKARDGALAVAWGAADPLDLETVEFLRERAGLFLEVAAKEIASGEAQAPAPECSR